MRRVFAAIAIALTLTLSTIAGDIQFPGVTQQPPPPPPSQSASTVEGEGAGSGGDTRAGGDGEEAADPSVEAALSLLRTLLSLI